MHYLSLRLITLDNCFLQQDGKRYYKIRWVRFSWEPEDAINHLKDLLDDFWQQNGGVQNIKDKVLHHVINGDQDNVDQNEDKVCQFLLIIALNEVLEQHCSISF